MIEAELPDGTVLEFPEGTSPEVVQRAVKARLGVAPAVEAKPRGLGEGLARQAGLSARMLINGLTGLPALGANALGGLYNAGANAIQGEGQGFRFQDTNAALNDTLTNIGLPAPENNKEKLVQAVGSALTGAGAGAKVGEKVGGLTAEVLTKNLPTQFAGAAAGATAAETVRQQGGNPWLQAAAAVLGGTAGAGLVAGSTGAAKVGHRAIEAFTQAGRNNIKARLLTELSGNRRYELIDALEANKTTPLRNKNTTALAAADLNMPEIAAAEKYLGGKYAGNAAAQIAETNATNRANALKSISGTQAQRDEIAKAITEQGKVAYGKAFSSDAQRLDALNDQTAFVRSMGGATGLQAPARIPDELLSLQGNPVIKAAMKEAEVLARSKGIPLVGNPMESLQGLHLMKLSIDNQFKNRTASTALQNYSDDALNSTKQALLRGIEGVENQPGVSPLYGVARQQYAESNIPLNQMKIGQVLTDKLIQPLDEGVERSGLFAQALRDAPGTLKKTLGGRQQTLEEVMSPEQMAIINNVSDELSRLAVVNRQASQGMPSAVQKLGEPFEMPNIPTLLSAPVSIAKSVLQAARGEASEQTLKDLAVILQDPGKTAEILKNLQPKEQIAFIQAVKRLGLDITLGATYGNMPYKENAK